MNRKSKFRILVFFLLNIAIDFAIDSVLGFLVIILLSVSSINYRSAQLTTQHFPFENRISFNSSPLIISLTYYKSVHIGGITAETRSKLLVRGY